MEVPLSWIWGLIFSSQAGFPWGWQFVFLPFLEKEHRFGLKVLRPREDKPSHAPLVFVLLAYTHLLLRARTWWPQGKSKTGSGQETGRMMVHYCLSQETGFPIEVGSYLRPPEISCIAEVESQPSPLIWVNRVGIR